MPTTRGKERFTRPVAFDSGIVSIGDFLTFAPATDSVVVGKQSQIDVTCVESTVVGAYSAMNDSSNGSVIAGARNLIASTSFWSQIVGYQSLISATAPACTLVGRNSVIGVSSFNAILLGTASAIGDSSEDTILMGAASSIGVFASHTVVIGFNSSAGGGCSYSVVIGDVASTAANFVVVVGQGAFALAGATGASVYGIQCSVDGVGYSSAFGSNSHTASTHSRAWGDQIVIATGSTGSLAIGDGFGGYTVGDLCPGSIAIGSNVHVGTIYAFNPGLVGCLQCHAIGDNSSIGDGSSFVTVFDSTAGTTCQNSFVAVNSTVSNAVVNAFAIAGQITGSTAIALFGAAGANECVIGGLLAATAFHLFNVKGFNGGSLDVLKAVDNPGANDTGLTVTYNDGATTTSKQISAAVAPPVGALLLYMLP